MADLVGAARGRRGNAERGDLAIAVQGALPARQINPAYQLLNWRGNHGGPVKRTARERDQELIEKLRHSRRVNDNELCSYVSPAVLLEQGEDVDPINADICDIINNMARTRRMMLDLLLESQSKSKEMEAMEYKLQVWPTQVYQLQGQVIDAAVGARYLRVPDVLLTKVQLIS